MPIQGVYPVADVCGVGEQISSTYEGRHVTLFPDNISHGSQVTIVTKGYGVWFEDAVGMPFVTQTATTNLLKQGTIDTEGIWCVDVKGETDVDLSVAVAVGDRLYINTTTGLVSKVSAAATQLPFGYALGIVGSGSTERIAVKVHWDPVYAAALEVRGTPGAGIVFASIGSETYPLVYAAASDKALEVWATFTLATEGGFYGIESDVAYEPIGDAGWASPVGIVGRVTLKAGVEHTGGQSGLEGVRGHLSFEDTSELSQHNAIYSGLRGVLTHAGTPVFTDFGTLACLYCDNLISIDLAGISTYYTEFGSGLISLQNHGGTLDSAIVIRGGNKITDVFHFSSMGGGAIDNGTKGGAGFHMRITVDGGTKYINIYDG